MNNLPDFDPVAEFHRQVNATSLNKISLNIRGNALQPSKGMRMTQTQGGTTAVPIVKRTPTLATPPFWPRFKPAEPTAAKKWVVTISKGIVVDSVTNNGDAVAYHELLDLIDENGQPAEFPINPGEAVYVTYGVEDTGAILTDAETKPRIYIGADGETSEHYDPPVGNESTGTAGNIYRKLAVFDLDGDGMIIAEMFEAGNNIYHWRDLPMFQKAGGTADIFKDYSLTLGKYKTRGITGNGITITERSDDIEIKNEGWWGDATVTFTPVVGATQYLTLRFEAGLLKKVFTYASGEISGTESAPGTAVLAVVDTDT